MTNIEKVMSNKEKLKKGIVNVCCPRNFGIEINTCTHTQKCEDCWNLEYVEPELKSVEFEVARVAYEVGKTIRVKTEYRLPDGECFHITETYKKFSTSTSPGITFDMMQTGKWFILD
jgi:hypothetical protein